MRPLTLGLGLACLLVAASCEPAGERVFAVVADTTRLTSTPRTYSFDHPLGATDDENGVCFHLPPGAEPGDDGGAIPAPGASSIRFDAEARLVNGRVVPLVTRIWDGGFCLQPERQGALPSPVQELRVWASAPVTVTQITWHSTHK